MEHIEKLLDIMRQLRDPRTGCPWDVEQDFRSIAPYTVEEAYEVADAIERGDLEDLAGELGDLLLQVVFHAQMAAEQGAFEFNDVVEGICAKLVSRHPHVFGDRNASDAAAVRRLWERQKAREREAREVGHLDTVPRALPGLKRAQKLGKRAASVGFDWPDSGGVIAKIHEEVDEFTAAHAAGSAEAAREEYGDLLFALVNLGRHLDIDAETALQGANAKFIARFGHLEAALARQGRSPAEATLDELEALWQAAKGGSA